MAFHVRGLEDAILLRYPFSPNLSIDSEQSQVKLQKTFFVETDKLNLKFIWKYRGHRIAKQFHKRNFERLYYLISRITVKL